MDGSPFDQTRGILDFTTTGFAQKDLAGRFLGVTRAFGCLVGHGSEGTVGPLTPGGPVGPLSGGPAWREG